MTKARIFCIDDDTFTLDYLKDVLSERYSVGTCSESIAMRTVRSIEIES